MIDNHKTAKIKQPNRLSNNLITSIIGALAFIIMRIITVPLIPSAPYLKYEPSGAVLLLAATIIGPVSGIIACLIKDLLYFVMTGANIFGIISDFACTGTYVFTVALIMNSKYKIKSQVFIALILGTIISALIMIPVNYMVLFFEFGMTMDKVTAIQPALITFNLLKGVLNGAVYLVFIQPIGKAIVQSRVHKVR